jgi:membrane protein DedA with SNARE-associated domain
MLPEALTEWISALFGRFNYLAPFAVLLLCGVGLPVPEEVTLIGSGILLHRGQVEFVKIVVTCGAAILIGDSIPFWLGRHYGMSALRLGFVRRVLHPERFARLEERFRAHGNWATFVCRFFAGVRIPGYFLAGTMKMSYARFLLLDTLGILISVPVSIYLGKWFGDSIDTLKQRVGDLHLILAFLALSLVIFILVRARVLRKKAAP